MIIEEVLRESGQCFQASLEVFFSKGSGKEFPEFFEKSIDKQKIDAILNGTVRFWSGSRRGCDSGTEPSRVAHSGKDAGSGDHSDTRRKRPSGTMRLARRVGNGAGRYRLVFGGCSLKSVE